MEQQHSLCVVWSLLTVTAAENSDVPTAPAAGHTFS